MLLPAKDTCAKTKTYADPLLPNEINILSGAKVVCRIAWQVLPAFLTYIVMVRYDMIIRQRRMIYGNDERFASRSDEDLD